MLCQFLTNPIPVRQRLVHVSRIISILISERQYKQFLLKKLHIGVLGTGRVLWLHNGATYCDRISKYHLSCTSNLPNHNCTPHEGNGTKVNTRANFLDNKDGRELKDDISCKEYQSDGRIAKPDLKPKILRHAVFAISSRRTVTK
jgi:hypothetical protein